jgi:hypothetical protein
VAWTGVVVWAVVTLNPWLVPVCLFLLLGTVVWLYERTLSRTKPGDDAQVRLLGLIRIVLRRGIDMQDQHASLLDDSVPETAETGHDGDPRRDTP